MPDDPRNNVHVTRSPSFELTLSQILGEGRLPTGSRPSIQDFEDYYWPALVVALGFTWQNAAPVFDDSPNLRASLIEPVRGIFPPARVTFIASPVEPGLVDIEIKMLGIEFDWTYRW